eukprot:scaffold469498_cov24-Prasinocladus_malaysianus.AAC.1
MGDVWRRVASRSLPIGGVSGSAGCLRRQGAAGFTADRRRLGRPGAFRGLRGAGNHCRFGPAGVRGV